MISRHLTPSTTYSKRNSSLTNYSSQKTDRGILSTTVNMSSSPTCQAGSLVRGRPGQCKDKCSLRMESSRISEGVSTITITSVKMRRNMIWTALKQVLVKRIEEGFHKQVKLHVAWSQYCSFPFLTKHRYVLDISGWKHVSSEVKPTKGLSCSKTAGDLTCAERDETEDGSKPHCSRSRTWGYQVLLCKPSESRE